MKRYTNNKPEFSDEIIITEVTDWGHADNVNKAPEQLLQNTLVLKKEVDSIKKNLERSEIIVEEGKENKIEQLQNTIEEIDTPQLVEFDEREIPREGDDQKALWGKIKKWLSDLKDAAFCSVSNHCMTTEKGSVLDARQGTYLQNQIVEINSNMNALKKSVADGKSAIASAITGKGVSTAADAEFAAMASNIGKIKNNPTIQKLGSYVMNGSQGSTGWNGMATATRTVSAASIPGYQNLTANNFILSFEGFFHNNGGEENRYSIGAPGKSYNPSTGILTFSASYRNYNGFWQMWPTLGVWVVY